jgi:hypothetical protein
MLDEDRLPGRGEAQVPKPPPLKPPAVIGSDQPLVRRGVLERRLPRFGEYRVAPPGSVKAVERKARKPRRRLQPLAPPKRGDESRLRLRPDPPPLRPPRIARPAHRPS